MHCGGCVRRVTGVLTAVPGVAVKDVTVGSATISIDPARTTPEAALAALKAAGYPARLEGEHVSR
jgi:copper chaperone